MKRPHVVIVGGGFGGIKAALDLAKDARLSVTLVSDKNYFQYFPSLYHTATGGRLAQSKLAFSDIFTQPNIDVVIGKLVHIDRGKSEIKLDSGHQVHFDKLILALGVVTNYFGIKGLSEFAYGTKSVDEAEALKKHLHDQLTDDHEPDMNYVIVGGGPTGIELAGAMSSYLKTIMKNHDIRHRKAHIDLIEAAPRLLPRLPKSMGKAISHQLRRLGVTIYVGKTVEGETADALEVSGKPITSHSVIWTAGMATNPFFKDNGFTMSDHGKVVVNDYLETEDGILIIGDDAATAFSGMAQTAIHDAKFVAKNLKRWASGKKPRKYKVKHPITVIPAGPKWAAVEWGNHIIYGKLGWWLREAADLVAFHDFEPWAKASKQFATEFGTQEECPFCSNTFSKN
jgi:NADH dehydrogenase